MNSLPIRREKEVSPSEGTGEISTEKKTDQPEIAKKIRSSVSALKVRDIAGNPSEIGLPGVENLSKMVNKEEMNPDNTSLAGNDDISSKPSPAERISSKEKEIAEKSGEIWDCFDSIDSVQGKYYLFRHKDEFNFVLPTNRQNDKLNQNLIETFPAIERPLHYLLYLNPNYHRDIKNYFEKKGEVDSQEAHNVPDFDSPLTKELFGTIGKTLNRLGYEVFVNESGDWILKLPDRDTLLANWESLRKEKPALPSLKIKDSPGIASDKEFIDDFFNYDVILSNGKEFLHDHILHLLPTLIAKLSDERRKGYIEAKEQFKNEIKKVRDKITKIERNNPSEKKKKTLVKIEAWLSAAIDNWTASRNPKADFNSSYLDMQLLDVWSDPVWQNYWKKRFSDEVLDFTSITINIQDLLK